MPPAAPVPTTPMMSTTATTDLIGNRYGALPAWARTPYQVGTAPTSYPTPGVNTSIGDPNAGGAHPGSAGAPGPAGRGPALPGGGSALPGGSASGGMGSTPTGLPIGTPGAGPAIIPWKGNVDANGRPVLGNVPVDTTAIAKFRALIGLGQQGSAGGQGAAPQMPRASGSVGGLGGLGGMQANLATLLSPKPAASVPAVGAPAPITSGGPRRESGAVAPVAATAPAAAALAALGLPAAAPAATLPSAAPVPSQRSTQAAAARLLGVAPAPTASAPATGGLGGLGGMTVGPQPARAKPAPKPPAKAPVTPLSSAKPATAAKKPTGKTNR
jgi:hypothetical protein